MKAQVPALRAWRTSLDSSAVVTDPAILSHYETATFATRERILAVLRPKNADHIPEALRIAARHRIAVHPVSRGCNWGYGCRVPLTTGAVVLDLGRLDRIRDFNDALGYVTVEPGVTFRQLATYLEQRRSQRIAPAVGSSPHASVLANALERGIGTGAFAFANRIESLCDLRVVLSTGERIRTGFGRWPQAKCRPVHRFGVGPSLDGLFSQSGLGVVVGATVWLARRPAYGVRIHVIARHARIGKTIVALRQLMQTELLRGVIKLSNRYSALMSTYADAVRKEGAFPIPRPLSLRGKERTWSCVLELVGDDPRELRARATYVHEVLAASVDQASKTPVRPWSSIETLDTREDRALDPAYWRAAPPIPSSPDPRRDGRGIIFCSPTVPLESAHLLRAVGLLEQTFLAKSFEPYITVNVMNERVANIVAAIVYDRRTPGEDRRAMQAYRNAFAACNRNGYYPYRIGNQSAGELPSAFDDSDVVIERIAQALDPAGVLSKSRYRPRRRGQ